MRRKCGFTLVEVLVAVAILLITLAALVPAIQSASGPLKNGTRVTTPDGKVGTILGRSGDYHRIKVRLLMPGPNGGEQYQEVEFMAEELKPVAEKER